MVLQETSAVPQAELQRSQRRCAEAEGALKSERGVLEARHLMMVSKLNAKLNRFLIGFGG